MDFYNLNEMKRRLAELDAERGPLVKLIEAAEAYERRASNTVSPPASPRPSSQNSHIGKTVLQITEDVALERIRATGAPVQTREVIAIMQEQGLPLPNKNLTNVVSARLSNSERVEGRRGVGWWPKGRPWPHEEPSLTISESAINYGRFNEIGEAEASPKTGEPDSSPNDTQSHAGNE